MPLQAVRISPAPVGELSFSLPQPVQEREMLVQKQLGRVQEQRSQALTVPVLPPVAHFEVRPVLAASVASPGQRAWVEVVALLPAV